MPAFTVGDIVRLRTSDAENWLDPKLRLREEKGIPATIKDVFGTALTASARSYRVEFHSIGRMKAMSEIIHARHLEFVRTAEGEAG